MELCSIVVPVYNVEKYLDECITSILNQTFRDFKLILVDDGSNDSSGEICDSYASKDDRVQVIHKKNGGVSSARNVGIEQCHSKYLMFIDSDDYLDDSFIERMVQGCKENTECVISGFRMVFQEKTIDKRIPQMSISDDETFSRVYPQLECSNAIYAIYGKLYRLDIINKYNIRFAEDFSILEDSSFVVEYIGRCRWAELIPNIGYNYRQIEEESLVKKFNENNIEAVLYKFNRGKLFEKKLTGKSRNFYYQSLYTWLNIYTMQNVRRCKTAEDFANLKKRMLQDDFKKIVRKTKYERVRHLKYNVILWLMKHQKFDDIFKLYKCNING